MTPTEQTFTSPVLVSIVNWNRWQDTVECLESVVRLAYAGSLHIVVCDNASSDGSVAHIREWLRSAGHGEGAARGEGVVDYQLSDNRSLVIISNAVNAGYAGGNNVALQYGLQKYRFDYAWILNNDTVVAEDSLREMVARMNESSDIGMCGATLVYHDKPHMVQAYAGVKYSVWTGRGKALGEGRERDAAPSREWVERNLTYVSGACMLVSKRFIDAVGLLSERYFMYFEELDWVARNRGAFKLGFAPAAVVYHKEGATIGTVSRECGASLLSEFYLARNKLAFTKAFYPLCVVTVWCVMLTHAMKRLLKGQRDNGRVLVEVLMGRQTPRPEWTIKRDG